MLWRLSFSKASRSLIFVYGCVLFFVLFPVRIDAEVVSLNVTPTITHLEMKRGDIWTSSITITNTNEKELTYVLRVGAFSRDEYGLFVPDPISQGDVSDVANAPWIKADFESVSIPAGGSSQVPFKISVPIDASPDEYRLALFIGTAGVTLKGESGASTVGYVSSIFSIKVSGTMVERGLLKELSIEKSVSFTGPISLRVKFANSGTNNLAPRGTLTLANFFAEESNLTEKVEFPVIPAGKTGLVQIETPDVTGLIPGYYEAQVRLAYGTKSPQFSTASVGFWVLPVHILIWLLISVFVVIAVIMVAVRRGIRSKQIVK